MVIDTSIFIEFLRAKDKTKTALFLIPDDEQIFISSITLYELLMGSKLKDFKVFLEKYADKIVQKWIDYFVYHRNIEFEKINTRIK